MLQPLKLFLQSVSVTMAVYVATSRVADNKHHTTDVIAGFALGSIIALAAVGDDLLILRLIRVDYYSVN